MAFIPDYQMRIKASEISTNFNWRLSHGDQDKEAGATVGNVFPDARLSPSDPSVGAGRMRERETDPRESEMVTGPPAVGPEQPAVHYGD